jgi:hypothetical protein
MAQVELLRNGTLEVLPTKLQLRNKLKLPSTVKIKSVLHFDLAHLPCKEPPHTSDSSKEVQLACAFCRVFWLVCPGCFLKQKPGRQPPFSHQMWRTFKCSACDYSAPCQAWFCTCFKPWRTCMTHARWEHLAPLALSSPTVGVPVSKKRKAPDEQTCSSANFVFSPVPGSGKRMRAVTISDVVVHSEPPPPRSKGVKRPTSNNNNITVCGVDRLVQHSLSRLPKLAKRLAS